MSRKILLALVLLLCTLTLWACSTNPATGKSQLNAISTSQEISLGNEAEPQFLADNGGEIPSAGVRSYVTAIGQRLASVSERRDLPWEFHVLDSSVINAFALPGGKVFISRGLLAKMENEAQLAGVLGHEVGHVTAQHIGQQMTRAIGIQVLGTALGAAGSATNKEYLTVLGAGTQAGGAVYLLKFGRDQESQADELGMRYMSRLGYNPQAQLQVMQILKRESGSAATFEFLSTHPLPDTRIKQIQNILKEQYPDYKTASKYKYGQQEFQSNILRPLAALPAPKHNPKPQ